MTERGRVLLIFGIVAAVAGAGAFYFFGIYQPAQELEVAQEQVTAWEVRYQEARGCLLGKTPGSTKTSEALAIREMAPDPWDRKKCTPLVSKLSRGEMNDTGIEKVEASWAALDKAANKAALAYATHVGSSTTLETDPLPAALDALDKARLDLRAATKMAKDEQVGTALPPAQLVPITDGESPLTELRIDAIPSSRGLVVFGKTDNRLVQVVLEPGGKPRVGRIGPGAMRAVPDLTWGATPGMLYVRGKGSKQDSAGEVKAGALDAEGAMATPQSLELVVPIGGTQQAMLFEQEPLEAGDQFGAISLAAVVGTLADGAIVYGGYQTLAIARAKDNTVKADPSIKINVGTASMDVDGRAAVVWTTLDNAHKALLIKPGGEEAFELPDSFAGAPCMTKDRIWVMATVPEVFAFGGGKPLARVKTTPASGLQGCTADVAILRVRTRPEQLAVCADECRQVNMPTGAPVYSAVTVANGKLYAISSHAGVLGVWSEHKAPVFYALPAYAKPVHAHEWPAMALTDGKVIDVIARGDKTFTLIRIPVP